MVDLLAGEECDCIFHRVLLLAEVQDISVGLGIVKYAVRARKRLNQVNRPDEEDDKNAARRPDWRRLD